MAEAQKAWRCTVCGYIHKGPEPPEVCPICGAGREMFEAYEEHVETDTEVRPDSWRCLNCEYIHKGENPPDVCPVCAAPAERFEPYSRAPGRISGSEESGTILIAGAGIAGVSAAEAARENAPEARVILLSKEEELPYYRLNLTRYLAGEVDKKHLPLHPEEWYRDNAIELINGAELAAINTDKRMVTLRDGEDTDYDRLVIAIGSHPFVPPFPGANRENVTVLRTKADADFILSRCSRPIQCVVIGGGVLGLEAAGGLARRGMDVTLLEGHGWLMPRQLNENAAVSLERHASAAGITLRKNARTKELVGDTSVRGVVLEDETVLPADLVVITTGVRSNSYIARLSNIDVNKGILVNNKLRSSAPDILAAGDVAEHQGTLYGTWGPSQFQGTIAGINAAGGSADFAGIPRSNMLKVLGYDMFSIGRITPEDGSYQVLESTGNGDYQFFMFRDSHLEGCILLGDTSLSAGVKEAIETQIDFSEALQRRLGTAPVTELLRGM